MQAPAPQGKGALGQQQWKTLIVRTSTPSFCRGLLQRDRNGGAQLTLIDENTPVHGKMIPGSACLQLGSQCRLG